MRRLPSLLAALSFAIALCEAGQAAPLPYHIAESIAGPDGGWDYASVDPVSRTLFIAHDGAVTAVSLEAGHAVRGFGAIDHGHAVVPLSGGRLAVTSGKDDSLRIFMQASGAQTGMVKVGTGPDAAIADAAHGTVLVMNAHGGTVSVVDPVHQKVIRTITLQPGLEFAALDRAGTLFVNNEDLNQIDVADPGAGKVMPPIALTGCEGPSGLAYDAGSDRLIAACANGKAAVVDAKRRKLVGLLDIGKGPDAVLLDARRRLAFIPCGRDGTLVEISLAGAQPQVIATLQTEVGARTGALDPGSGAIYLPTARFGPPPAPGKRPAALPGSFHIIVVRPSQG